MRSAAAPAAIAAWPLAARLADIGALPNVWRILVVDDGQEELAAEGMREELASLTELRVTHRRVRNAEELLEVCASAPDELLVLSGLSQLDEHDWRAVDVNRSRLERTAPTLLVASSRAAGTLPTLAPNLWSWIGDGVWRYEPEDGLPISAREQRLAELRRHFEFGDDELLRRARSGELPAEPDIAEWLVLLGAGELIPSEKP